MTTIHDVAQAAGVSISTVSYALSGKRSVSPATRLRIEDAVRELGYRANAGARMLASQRTQILALTEPFRADTHAPTHMAFVLATSIAARAVDYDVLLLTDAEASEGMRRVASSDLVDAIIALDVAPDDVRVPLARRIDVPTVFIGLPDDHDDLTCVDLDFDAAASVAVERLAAAGHRHIALLGQTPESYELSNFPPRVRTGFERAAASSGITATFEPLPTSPSSGAIRAVVGRILDGGPTALVVHSSPEAHTALLDEVRARNLSVPHDLSIVSVGSTLDTAALDVPLDTVPLVPQRSCELAVSLAMRLLEDDASARGIHLLPPNYLEHGSVTAPRPL